MATFDQKIKLLSGLLKGNKAINDPFYIDIDLTERCNLNCLGCPYHNVDKRLFRNQKKIPQDMSLEVLHRLFAELKGTGTHTFVIQGSGEPFLHPHLTECIKMSKQSGATVILMTNGTLLDTEIIQALSDARLDILKISLWATSEEQFVKNYPGTKPEIFQKIMDGLKGLNDFKTSEKSHFPAVQVNFIINNTNYRSIDEMIDLAVRSGSSSISFSPMINLREELDSSLLSPNQIKLFQKSLLQAKKRLKSLNIDHNIVEMNIRYRLGSSVWKKIPCYVTWYHVRIRADGTIQPCGRCYADVQVGNSQTSSFKDIWNGPLIREFRAKSRTIKGLASLQELCNCQYCCFLIDNRKIYRFMRWLPSFTALGRFLSDETH
jgi:MoaA/NifB/PqqE/SkfB family radical SAM enzyme